jgi:RNA polymerase sigma factor (sigma-70 family)
MKPIDYFENNKGLAYKICWQYCKENNFQFGDFVTEALAGLWHAATHYNESDGRAKFATYAFRCIKGSMQRWSALDWRVRRREKTNISDLFFRRLPENPGSNREKPDSAVLDYLMKFVKGREVVVIGLRYGIVDGSDWKLRAIGKHLGVSMERARQILIRGLRKIRDNAVEPEPEECRSNNVAMPVAPEWEGDESPWQQKAIRDWEDMG